jgi:hypothetical protein
MNIESETEIRDKTERVVEPEFSEIQGLKETIFKDVGDIIELKRSGEGVGIGRDPEEQDQEKTGSCG